MRRRADDHLETATYAAAVVHVDAIERKPLYHFAPGARVVTIGPPGCSLSCDYCQNYRLSQVGRTPSLAWAGASVDPLSLVALADKHDAMLGFSYSEPSLAIELTLAIAALTTRPLIWKTNGFMTGELLNAVTPHLTAVNVDLKAPDETRYRKLTGGALAPVVESLRRFITARVWVEVSTPLISEFNCDETSVRKMAEIILNAGGEDVPWHLLRFVPDFRLKTLRPTHPDELAAAVSWARAAGLRHVYVERALGAEARNTHCNSCGSEVVSRDIWQLAMNRLEHGVCPDCRAPVPGRW